MNDYDPACASEQVFVTGCDNQPPRTSFPFGTPPPDPPQDWHRADIIAAIRKTGTTLFALSRQHGLSTNTLANALTHKWPRAEDIIALHINVPPWVIWPSRYPDKVAWLAQTLCRRGRKPGTGRRTDPRKFLKGKVT